jgi:hypothetical protein
LITLSESFIESAAPNAEAAKNGRLLAMKGKFASLHLSPDENLLFGYCQGSGSSPYLCSADFTVASAPVYRCTCPSRQFPCKHSLGLLYARVMGKAFSPAEVPADLAAKREKAAQRLEKKKDPSAEPKKVNKSALAKKIMAQLEGIDLLEKLTLDLVRLGIGNMNVRSAHEIEEQARQLGNNFLPGARMALQGYTRLFYADDGTERSASEREAVFGEALDRLGRLHALVKHGRAYLNRRLEDPELAPETQSAIAAWLGHAWQLTELKAAGLVQTNAELVQVAFHTHDDRAREEIVDTGTWINLASGRIQLTQTFRPYKALNFIAAEDSCFDVARVDELCVYPGDINPRVRWNAMTPRPVTPADLARVRELAHPDFAGVVKEVKTHLKTPLASRHPIFALNFSRIGLVAGQKVVEDAKGSRLVMTDRGLTDEPATSHLLPLLPSAALAGQTLIARFRHDLDSRQLRIKPLAIVTPTEIIRLTL